MGKKELCFYNGTKTTQLIGGNSVLDEINEVIEKIRQGDTKAFGLVYDEYVKMVASVIRKVGRCSRGDVDFHINEVFFRVYKGIFSFKGNSKFSTYVYRIALNYSFQLSKKVRKESKRKVELDENIANEERHFEDGVVDGIFMEKLLDRLTDKLRAVVVLFYYESLSVKEIAEVENISEAAVKNRLFQARDKIKQMITEDKNA